jgi:serine kinase of HPr protein (carbohydrate metabolism regulator)
LKQARELVHGTCVALGRRGVLLRGGAGSGKSDLALRFMALPGEGALCPGLVADDQVYVSANPDGTLTASAPPTIAGKIEVRGLGIMPVPFLPEAELVLVCDLVGGKDVPRMPPESEKATVLAGVPLPTLRLAPFEASAPLKLKMALLRATPDNAN